MSGIMGEAGAAESRILLAAREPVLAATAQHDGTQAHQAAVEALRALSGADLLEVAAVLACQLARPGEIMLSEAEHALLIRSWGVGL